MSEHPELHQLIEVVMDLGRKPLARFPSGDFVLSDFPITVQDIEHATSQVKLVLYHALFDYWIPSCKAVADINWYNLPKT